MWSHHSGRSSRIFPAGALGGFLLGIFAAFASCLLELFGARVPGFAIGFVFNWTRLVACVGPIRTRSSRTIFDQLVGVGGIRLRTGGGGHSRERATDIGLIANTG